MNKLVSMIIKIIKSFNNNKLSVNKKMKLNHLKNNYNSKQIN